MLPLKEECMEKGTGGGGVLGMLGDGSDGLGVDDRRGVLHSLLLRGGGGGALEGVCTRIGGMFSPADKGETTGLGANTS